MNRRTALTLVSLMLLLALAAASHAGQTMYSDRATWEAAVPAWADVDLTGYPEFSTLTSVGLPALAAPATTLSFDVTQTVYQVPGSWPTPGATWVATTPRVLFSGFGVSSVTGTFDSPLLGFGLEMEPNLHQALNMTLTLASGETLTQSVDPLNGGAKFFGFWGNTGVTGWTASLNDPFNGFAMGRLVVANGPAGNGSPELSTWMLLACSGLAGLVIRRRRRS
jgi:hypothetical protein